MQKRRTFHVKSFFALGTALLLACAPGFSKDFRTERQDFAEAPRIERGAVTGSPASAPGSGRFSLNMSGGSLSARFLLTENLGIVLAFTGTLDSLSDKIEEDNDGSADYKWETSDYLRKLVYGRVGLEVRLPMPK